MRMKLSLFESEKLARVETVTFRSFKEKEHIVKQLRKKYNEVKMTFLDNTIIYQYVEEEY
ncbi:hypothetical protein [uncultured Metabacillus sp.]|uniref:hypothetical protein n=1 Tax=uncultured Metabacillus sp. TaxID=2860135 RepID=UPI002633CDA4|nr:hypothetical protein [uncultured Metabacillus sp.]